MSLFKLAFMNIKLNRKKYSMYIFSMSFSVFTAYTFLALMQNKTVKMAFEYDVRYRSLLLIFGIIIMVFVLFFLISSNNSFIKARKKEISTYALFGMTNMKIGKLLFLETIIVGMATLVIGIGLGVFFSKLVAMFLLKISLSNFVGGISFSIDFGSILITILLFFTIFCMMGLSGLRVIFKFELVDLFKADKLSEGKARGSAISLILSLLLIGGGYFLASSSDGMLVVKSAILILVLVIVGTYLFFWGGLPIILKLIKGNKKIYYKGVNLISTSAFSHRIKSIATVMATIAVLSAVATTAIATGFTLYSNAENSTYGSNKFDMYYYGNHEELQGEVHDYLADNKVTITDEYTTELYIAEPKMNKVLVGGIEYFSEGIVPYCVYSQSDYNKFVRLSKNNVQRVDVPVGKGLYSGSYSSKELEGAIIGQHLKFTGKDIAISSIIDAGIPSFGEGQMLILNDNDFNALLIKGDIKLSSHHKATIFNYDNALKSEKINSGIENILKDKTEYYATAYTMYNEGLETFGLICFIGFFMSAVFILMTASLLYFKQVMAAEEERHQYRMLR